MHRGIEVIWDPVILFKITVFENVKKIGLREVIWVRDLLNDVCLEATFIQITRARTIWTRKKLSLGADY